MALLLLLSADGAANAGDTTITTIYAKCKSQDTGHEDGRMGLMPEMGE